MVDGKGLYYLRGISQDFWSNCITNKRKYQQYQFQTIGVFFPLNVLHPSPPTIIWTWFIIISSSSRSTSSSSKSSSSIVWLWGNLGRLHKNKAGPVLVNDLLVDLLGFDFLQVGGTKSQETALRLQRSFRQVNKNTTLEHILRAFFFKRRPVIDFSSVSISLCGNHWWCSDALSLLCCWQCRFSFYSVNVKMWQWLALCHKMLPVID